MRKFLSNISTANKIAFALLLVVVIAFAVYFALNQDREPADSVIESDVQRLEQYVQENPTDTAGWVTLGNLYLQQRNYNKAIAQYQKALSLDEDIAAAHMGLGLAYMKKGDNDLAVASLNRAVAIIEESEFAQSSVSLATLYYYLGKTYLEQGELELATDELNKCLAITPTNADAIFLVGQIYEAQGDLTAAEANYMRAVQLTPDYAEVYDRLSLLYAGQGDDVRADFNAAMATLFYGNAELAAEKLTIAVMSMPDNAEAYWGLGWAYEKMNLREEAIAAYQMAVSIDPEQRLAAGALMRLGASVQ